IPIIGPLGVQIGGIIGAKADFGFGFDTRGFAHYADTHSIADIFTDGFYVRDTKNGKDIPEISITFGLTASAELNVVVGSAGVTGAIISNVDFNLHDLPEPAGPPDGKVHLDELARRFALGPTAVFDIDGAVKAKLSAFLRILFSEQTFDLAEVTLLNFH